ncbi:hypothetical protein CVO96_20430 [Deinococcus koreensis]|uniref:DUF3224 domain-containing protein n=1 Tax=Deinococcus koreensis TaxID=2054903 RepID=A0A2K3URP4_9DEIO|nr:hypothetical protein CVO96_20430 [Deinococcus koreensis]
MGLVCEGTTAGTLTHAAASLSLTVASTGAASGSFTNNGTLFQATGTAAVRDDGQTLYFNTLNLNLDSRVEGRATALLGFRSAGLSAQRGSTGLLTGTLNGQGRFTGTFKGVQGNYRADLTCRGA